MGMTTRSSNCWMTGPIPPKESHEMCIGGDLSIMGAAFRFFFGGSPFVSCCFAGLSMADGRVSLGVAAAEVDHALTMLLFRLFDVVLRLWRSSCSTSIISSESLSLSCCMVSSTRSMVSSRSFLGRLLRLELDRRISSYTTVNDRRLAWASSYCARSS